jgi:hypothetical protein
MNILTVKILTMKQKPEKKCCSTDASYEEKVQHLLKVAKSILCYLPKAYDAPGPHGELSSAIWEVEHE